MPAMDFDLLKAHAIKKSKEFLYSHPEYRPTFWERLKLKYFLFLRKKGYSVAAITGHKEFYGLDFFVNKHVLIPRPETEMIVDEVLNLKSEILNHKSLLIDVGAGSGCIPISILENVSPLLTKEGDGGGFSSTATTPNPSSKRRGIQTLATDISRSALRVAKKNAKKHNVDIKFFHGNLLEPILKRTSDFGLQTSEKIVITANLPYLTLEQFQTEPSIQREPKKALVADNNGLALYEELLGQIKNIKQILNKYLKNIIVFLEIDHSQTEAISKLIKQNMPQAKVEIKKDLAGRDRLVIIKISAL